MAEMNNTNRPSPGSFGARLSSTGRQAFTLIELMVVIFIIGILIALVVGVGKYVYDEAARKETESTMAIVMEAIEAFKSVAGEPPADTGVASEPDYSDEALLLQLLEQPTDGGVQLREHQGAKIKQTCQAIMLKLPSDAFDGTSIKDAYGNDLRYEADGGFGNTPVLISAGNPDGVFGNEDDIRSDR